MIDDAFLERVEQGMTTEIDAYALSLMAARFASYELALREIAAYGTGRSADLACRVLASDGDGLARAA